MIAHRATRALRIATLSVLSLALLVAAASPARAEAASAKKLIEDKNSAIHEVIKATPDEAALRLKIQDLMESFVDYDELARLTIKTEWDALSAEKRADFVAAFKRLIHRTYTRRFKANQSFSVDFLGEPVEREGKAQVRTTIHSGKTTADVYYSMYKPEGKDVWWVYDLVIDDVSLMRNYRTQFTRVLKKDGFDKLLERIRSKGDSDDDGNDDI